MSAANNYLRDAILDHISGQAEWTAPSNLYLALCKSAVSASDTPSGNAAKELLSPGTDGYARQEITLAAAGGTGVGIAVNDAVITFGAATADWATVAYWWILDTSTVSSGNILYQGALPAAKTVEEDGSLSIAAGDLRFLAA